jgi:putative glutamine amidotransferase
MKNRLLVGVSQRVDFFHERGEQRDALDQRVSQWISKLGCIPVPIPNNMGGFISDDDVSLQQWLAELNLQAFVLSGGNDIGEAPERDQTERQILDYASSNNMPLLGICRGMQMMGIWSGASLKPVSGHVRTRHRLQGNISSEVNSFHNLSLEGCPAGFAVLATTEHGEIEAISHQSLPWEGWMWHPERESVFSAEQLHRARNLLHAG